MNFNQKHIIMIWSVVILTGLAGIIFFVTFFHASQSQKPPQVNIPKIIQPTLMPESAVYHSAGFSPVVMPSFTPPVPSVPPQVVAKGWKKGVANKYSIEFPPDWQANMSNVTGGGTTATFLPSIIAGTKLFPRLEVEADPSSTVSVEQRIAVLAPLHFVRTDVLFHGVPATLVSGTLPFPVKSSDGRKIFAYKAYLFFSYNSTTYIVDYVYDEDGNALSNQQILSTMLATFSFLSV
jgi:hypothetical protein